MSAKRGKLPASQINSIRFGNRNSRCGNYALLSITTDPEIMHGAVCFRGTRVPVSVVLDNLADGETVETILDQYPSLKPEHVPAAIAFAAELARERIVPIPA